MSNVTIVKADIVGNEIDFHSVIATLSDGRRAEFHNVNLGHRHYPHAGTRVHVFDKNHVEGGVIVFRSGNVELLDRDGKMIIGCGGHIVIA